jgi:hypothetical protein
MITLFTAPKPFAGHIGVIQRNAIRSWMVLGDQVEVLMIGDEAGMDQAAAELGVIHLPTVERNEQGTPLLNSIFATAQEQGLGDLFGYLNADIMLTRDFLPALKPVSDQFKEFLIVGQRWDIQLERELTLDELSDDGVLIPIKQAGTLHPPKGSDYFVFARGQFSQIPPFALGRSGWDNWMIFEARSRGLPVIDASQTITVLHQDHDYQHLPGGQSHYRLPESRKNVELAGGQETMFTLADATYRLVGQELERKRFPAPGWWRRLEAGLIAGFGAGRLARITRMLFHLPSTLRYFRQRGRVDVESMGVPDAKHSSPPQAGT